jgi:hypothetical protein
MTPLRLHVLTLCSRGGSDIQATVANDDRVTSPVCYPNLHIDITDESFNITCYGLSLGSFDMVLDEQWLVSLGHVL